MKTIKKLCLPSILVIMLFPLPSFGDDAQDLCNRNPELCAGGLAVGLAAFLGWMIKDSVKGAQCQSECEDTCSGSQYYSACVDLCVRQCKQE